MFSLEEEQILLHHDPGSSAILENERSPRHSYISSQEQKILRHHTGSTAIIEDERSSHYSIFPRKLYTVVGPESSGTTLVAGIISKALNVSYREGSEQYDETYRKTDERAEAQVQHFSLPWGGICSENISRIVDVVLPPQCARSDNPQPIQNDCQRALKEIYGYSDGDGHSNKTFTADYPERFFLNI